MKICLTILALVLPLLAQSDRGEIRLKVTDPSGLGVQCTVKVTGESTQFSYTNSTDSAGLLDIKGLYFGPYTIEVTRDGFQTYTRSIEVRSQIPVESSVHLIVAAANETITVNDNQTLVDPHLAGEVNIIGSSQLAERATSLPGRSVQDLVNSLPGWLYEGNAVLHPRGSEYQTQFVVDGIPLTDNRSPGFAPEIDADDVQSLSIYTAGFPAEYGRKMGGVVELNSKKIVQDGFHGEADLSGGSFATGGAYLMGQYSSGKNSVSLSADGAFTGRYLNPPVLQNFTNTANTGDFASRYDREFDTRNRLNLSVTHEIARFEIPNEQIQQQAGQLQTGADTETVGIASYQHVFSPNLLGSFVGMIRDDVNQLVSNQSSTPIIADQNRGFREGYFKGAIAGHHHRHEWKAGFEADFYNLHERFNYQITDPTRFDPGTPPRFAFSGLGYDREQALFAQDYIRLEPWSVSAGLRWDHYHLIVDQNAVSPRLAISRYFSSADVVVHASYDRIFQTPAFENILLSSSTQVQSLDPSVLRLPVRPSLGNYFELGMTKGIHHALRLDTNAYYRHSDNFADDDQLLNTSVSFPISFLKGTVYGAEAKIDVPGWGRWSGFASYSYMVGSVHFPVTGGLFLGDSAINAGTQLTGRFWDSQDQRNTLRARVRYQVVPRVWLAAGAEFGSGLPVDFDGTEQEALEQYGEAIVGKVDFETGRVRPSFSLDAAAGSELVHKDRIRVRMQVDVQNLTNRVNVIDFAGLFSGNSVAPSRSYALRLTTNF